MSIRKSGYLFALIVSAFACDAEAQIAPQISNCGANAGVNYGIQVQNCPIVNQAPTPTFEIIHTNQIVQNPDGSFDRSAVIKIAAPYVPGNILVAVSGPTVVGVNLVGAILLNVRSGRLTDGSYAQTFIQPWGKYTVHIKTSDEKTPAILRVQFNVDLPDPEPPH